MAKHSISLSDAVSAAANDATQPNNENRDFSNLCEVALTDYLTPRGYIIVGTGAKLNKEDAEFMTKLRAGLEKYPAARQQIEAVLRKHEGKRRVAAASSR